MLKRQMTVVPPQQLLVQRGHTWRFVEKDDFLKVLRWKSGEFEPSSRAANL